MSINFHFCLVTKMSTSSYSGSSSSDDEGVNYYKKNNTNSIVISGGAKNGGGEYSPALGGSSGSGDPVWWNPFSWAPQLSWFWWICILIVSAAAISGLILGAIALEGVNDDIVNGFSLDFKVLRRNVIPGQKDESEAEGIEIVQMSQSEKTAVGLHQGVLLQKKGNKIVGTTTQVGLGLSQAADGSVFVVNSGVLDIVLGGGLNAIPIPVTGNIFKRKEPNVDEDGNEYDPIDYGVESDTDERTLAPHPAGFKVMLTNIGVNSLKASSTLTPVAKRDVMGRSVDPRSVTYLSEGPGITVYGADNMTLEVINTGVINISSDSSLTIGGNQSFPVLSVTGFSPLSTISIAVTHTQLAVGATAFLQSAISGTARFVMMSISSRGSGGVNFAGGGGDRNIVLGAGARNWYTISAANLAAVGSLTYIPANAAPGFVPDPTNAPNSPTSAGDRFFLKYSGGTTDYSAGQIEINLVLMQTVQ